MLKLIISVFVFVGVVAFTYWISNRSNDCVECHGESGIELDDK